jgi:hypothetical protein
MDDQGDNQHQQDRDWERVDARILGQILATLNIIFVLPDETRIAEFYSQALNIVPGITSCHVCLGDQLVPARVSNEICAECAALRIKDPGSASVMPRDFICRLSDQHDLFMIKIKTIEHIFGFIVFRIESMVVFKPYTPFLDNLANYVALYLENRMQKFLLEKSRDELEDKVRKRTEELVTTNAQLEQEIQYRKAAEDALNRLNKELEQRVKIRTHELEEKNGQLERINRVFVGRELRMVELKERIRKLEIKPSGNVHEGT